MPRDNSYSDDWMSTPPSSPRNRATRRLSFNRNENIGSYIPPRMNANDPDWLDIPPSPRFANTPPRAISNNSLTTSIGSFMQNAFMNSDDESVVPGALMDQRTNSSRSTASGSLMDQRTNSSRSTGSENSLRSTVPIMPVSRSRRHVFTDLMDMSSDNGSDFSDNLSNASSVRSVTPIPPNQRNNFRGVGMRTRDYLRNILNYRPTRRPPSN